MPRSIPPELRDTEAAALRVLYDAQQPRPTHGAFAAAQQIGSAGMVWQYLSGHRPLNLGVATKFAQALGVPIDRFSPRLAAVAAMARGAGKNHMTVAQGAGLVNAHEPEPGIGWPFKRIDLAAICMLPDAEIDKLEDAWLVAAGIVGVAVTRRPPA